MENRFTNKNSTRKTRIINNFFQALVISYPTSTHVSYSMVITMQSLLTVAPFANFSFNKVAEIVNTVQIDKLVNKVRLGEPPPLIGF
jgi:hypothetical protein